jgi:hypothetical protein
MARRTQWQRHKPFSTTAEARFADEHGTTNVTTRSACLTGECHKNHGQHPEKAEKTP